MSLSWFMITKEYYIILHTLETCVTFIAYLWETLQSICVAKTEWVHVHIVYTGYD